MSPTTLIPLIVACALFMQNLDSTAVSTALPAIAHALGERPLNLHPIITVYMLAMAAFIPLSGWVADRFGARRVFCASMGLFVISSVMCGAATSLPELILLRGLQGTSGALMIPVARLIVVKSVPRSELVGAIALMGLPSLVGPLMGPLVGGVFTTYASWHWIFWINAPIGLAGILLALKYIPEIRESHPGRFDVLGNILTGVGLAALLFGLDMLVSSRGATPNAWITTIIGLTMLALYVPYARTKSRPAVDLSLFRLPTLRASIAGGSLFRLGVGALPFLLPLMLQQSFGFSPLQSGAVTCVTAAGSFAIRTSAKKVIARFGFRPVMVGSAVASGLFMLACGFFTAATPIAVMLAVIFCGGFFRSLEFTAINAIAYAEVDNAHMSHATSLTQMAQRLSLSLGVTVAALTLQLASGGAPFLPQGAYITAFVAIGLLSMSAAAIFARLHPEAGEEIAGRRTTIREVV